MPRPLSALSIACVLGCAHGEKPPPDTHPAPPAISSSPPPPSAPPASSASAPPGSRADFTITRGQTVDLPGGAKLRFDGHSHKDVTPEMGPSPLVIGGALTKPGGAPETFYVNVHLEHSKRFTVEGEDFELVDHVYGQSMHLRYLGPSR